MCVEPHDIRPPRPHSAKYLVDPNSHDSVSALAAITSSVAVVVVDAGAAASQWPIVNGLLNDEFRAASTNEVNIFWRKVVYVCRWV